MAFISAWIPQHSSSMSLQTNSRPYSFQGVNTVLRALGRRNTTTSVFGGKRESTTGVDRSKFSQCHSLYSTQVLVQASCLMYN